MNGLPGPKLCLFFFFFTITYNTNITYTTNTSYNTNITYNTYNTYNTNNLSLIQNSVEKEHRLKEMF